MAQHILGHKRSFIKIWRTERNQEEKIKFTYLTPKVSWIRLKHIVKMHWLEDIGKVNEKLWPIYCLLKKKKTPHFKYNNIGRLKTKGWKIYFMKKYNFKMY